MNKHDLISVALKSACATASLAACITSIKIDNSGIAPICWGFCAIVWTINTILTIKNLSK